MSILVLGFLFLLLVSFGLIVVVTRPSQDEKTLERRLSLINDPEFTVLSSSIASNRLLKTGVRSESLWVVDAVERYKLARKLRNLLIQSESKLSFERFLLTSAALAFGGFALSYWFFPLPAIAFASAVLMGAAPLLFLNYKRSKRLKLFNAQLSNSVDMMSNALRAGHSVVGAIGILAEQTLEPSGSEFREVFRQQSFGLPLRDALMEMLDRTPSADLRVVVTAILVQRDTGGNLGEILDRTVFVIRERVRIQGEIQVQTAQGRITGYILTLLPVVMMFLINLINPGYSKILVDDPFGRKLIYAGVVLLTLGALSIRHLINKIEV